jgi:hypothetical protein
MLQFEGQTLLYTSCCGIPEGIYSTTAYVYPVPADAHWESDVESATWGSVQWIALDQKHNASQTTSYPYEYEDLYQGIHLKVAPRIAC